MIKFTASDKETGRKLLAFGLSDGNLKKLRAGNPIHVNLVEMDPALREYDFMIFWGETEQSMYEELKPALKGVPIHEFKEKQ
jgi:hypothetical protein